MAPDRHSALALVLPLLGFVLVGAPLTAIVWQTSNRLFAGQGGVQQLGIGVVAAVALWLWLRLMGRVIERWNTDRRDAAEGRAP